MVVRDKPRVGISACLLGESVRYDGGHKRSASLIEGLTPRVEWVPVCPEVELGLGVPREPIRLVGRAETARLLGERTGLDHSQAMRAFAVRRVEALAALDLSGYVTKAGSPSCGLARVELHPEGGGPATREGIGAFVRVLRERLPLLPIEEETALEEPARRERFLERVFDFDRGLRAR